MRRPCEIIDPLVEAGFEAFRYDHEKDDGAAWQERLEAYGCEDSDGLAGPETVWRLKRQGTWTACGRCGRRAQLPPP